MIRDFNQYIKLLRKLLPRGRAWNPDGVVFSQVLAGKAVELARVDTRIDDLMRERDTRYTVELLPEQEAEYGIALITGGFNSAAFSNGFAAPATNAERQLALNTKLRKLGALTKAYYIALAATLGYTVTIDQYTPFWSGLGVSGQACGDQTNIFYWRVNVYTSPYKPVIGYNDLIALLTPLRPAHTIILWSLVGPAFSNGFSNGFNSLPAGVPNSPFSLGFNMGFGGGSK